MELVPCPKECRTRSNRPLALAIITPRAGTDAGNTALNVTVDIAKDEPPYAEENLCQINEKDLPSKEEAERSCN